RRPERRPPPLLGNAQGINTLTNVRVLTGALVSSDLLTQTWSPQPFHRLFPVLLRSGQRTDSATKREASRGAETESNRGPQYWWLSLVGTETDSTGASIQSSTDPEWMTFGVGNCWAKESRPRGRRSKLLPWRVFSFVF